MQLGMSRFVPIADIPHLVTAVALIAAVDMIAAVAMLHGEFEPSFGDFKQFGLFFFASSLLR